VVLINTDIGMFLTGGVANTNPALSLGGNVSTTEVVSDILHSLFRRITDTEASSGITIYRCVAIKNKNATDTMRNVVFYMVADTISASDLSLYSFAQADKNVAETPIANEFTEPAGVKIDFRANLNRTGGLNLGDLAPLEYINVWLRVSVNPGAVQFTENSFKVRVEVNSTGTSGPPDPGGGGGGPTPDPDPDTGVNFTMATTADTGSGSTFTTIVNRMKSRNAGHIMFNGDLAYSSSMTNWLNATSSVRSISKVSFGNHDVGDGDGSTQTINALKNAYSLPNTYYSYIFHSVGVLVLETGEHHSVPENTSSNQYTFAKQTLESFKANSALEWIFVFNHYPFYTVGSNHPSETDSRGWYEPLFDANGVDVVFHGHNHNMQHSKLIKYNNVVSGTDPNYSYSRATANHGKIYIIAGAGGRSHYGADNADSTFPFVNDSAYGYLFMEFSNDGKKITFKFYNSSDTLLKTFTLTHT
jgi:predicted phosphodiesterase